MPTNEKDNENQRKAGQANVTHRVNAFEARGEAALAPTQKEYLAELREMVRTQPGRLEIREELAAALMLICQLGFSHMRENAEKGQDIWESGVIGRLATYINALRMLLDNWPEDDKGRQNIIDIMKGKVNG
jgi:hypothetical protein